MIRIENIEVNGWSAAIRGMRNPMNSWQNSDTTYFENGTIRVGEKDLELMRKLVKAGSDHAKFMRMISVSMDITAPMYWWSQADTFKVGTVANSTSKMHTIHKTPITKDLFSFEAMEIDTIEAIYIEQLEELRAKFIETGDKKYWYALIQRLPESFNQKRTWQANYQVLHHIYTSRKDHKLDEWREFCEIIWERLPYFGQIIDTSKKKKADGE